MEPFIQVSGIAAPMLQANIDTDQIAPGISLLNMERTGAGRSLFSYERYCADGTENPDFILNRDPFRDTRFIVAGPNFGCGSSREMAVWALRDFGIRAIIAPSFGTIFANNCYINGVLPIVLPQICVVALAAELTPQSANILVDLKSRQITTPSSNLFHFPFPELQRDILLEGSDAISSTLKRGDRIADYQSTDRRLRPWIYRENPHDR